MIPYNLPPIGNIATSNTDPTVVEVPTPSRVFLARLIVAQIGGTDAFKVEIYSKETAANGATSLDEDGNTIAAANYKLGKTFDGASGIMEYFADSQTGGYGLPLFNDDNSDSQKRNQQRIWMKIWVPGGSGAKTFSLSGTVVSPWD